MIQRYRVIHVCQRYPRVKSTDAVRLIRELREVIGDDRLALMLGLKRVALDWKHQPVPVTILAFLLHRAIFSPGVPVTVLDLVTAGKYSPAGIPQGERALSAKILQKPNDFLEGFEDGSGI